MASKKDPNIEKIYREKITYVCPARGKVTQVVEVKRYRYMGTPLSRLTAEEVKELLDKYGLEETDI
jgi:hypothetical protein